MTHANTPLPPKRRHSFVTRVLDDGRLRPEHKRSARRIHLELTQFGRHRGLRTGIPLAETTRDQPAAR